MSKASKAQAHHPSGSRTHGVGVLREERHDPYLPVGKPVEGSECPDCHARVRRGAWRWTEAATATAATATTSATETGVPHARSGTAHRCPACERLRVHDPAAVITLDGRYVAEQLEPLRALIRHQAQHESAEHPLERIMEVEPLPSGGLMISTTGLHLARAIGHALQQAHKGELRIEYLQGQARMRVHWHRD